MGKVNLELDFKKRKDEYVKKFKVIPEDDLRKIVALLALKDVTIDALVNLLLKKKVIKKSDLNDEILKELKVK